MLLIYALDERGTTKVENRIPIIGYSLYFPKIENEVQVSYSASIKEELALEPMEDDDNSDNE
ncbi:putative endonuclease [Flavobacterium seoulense]|uniref:Putative endonuclease n=1 Tax=Flavobacterium seoulense TaxID=1492738 RepID=A0A066WRX2_9FLAO|nr:putative endonuclease [Flavobacterium seoulense]